MAPTATANNWSPPEEAFAGTTGPPVWSPPDEAFGAPQQPEIQVSAHPVTDELGRLVKQIPRGIATGIGALADLPGDIADLAYNQKEPQMPMFEQIASKGADVAGIQKPSNPLETAAQGAEQFAVGQWGPGLAESGLKHVVGKVGDLESLRQKLETFEKAGVSPTGVQVGTRGTAGAATKETLANQPKEAQAAVEGVTNQLAPKTSLTPESAGERIDAGVKTARQKMVQDEARAFDNAGNMIGRETPMAADNFSATAANINKPTGIPEVDNFLASTKAKQAESAAQATRTPQQAPAFNPDWHSVQSQPIPQPPMTYDSLRAMRSKIGQSIDWGLSPSGDVQANGELKQLYSALGKDLEAGISRAPPAAQTAYRQALDLYKSNATKRDLLDTVVGKVGGPEEIYKAATSKLPLGPTKIRTVMQAMGPEEQNVLKGTVLERLGHPSGALDRPWDENTFRTNWQNMTGESKTVLYGPKGSETRDKLEALNDVLQIRKNLGQNTSNLAEAVQKGVQGALPAQKSHGLANAGLVTLGVLGAGFHSVIEHVVAAHPVGAAVGLAGATLAGGARMAAKGYQSALDKALNNKTVLNWLSQTSKMPKAGLPVALAQLAHMGDDGMAVHDTIQGEQQ